MSIFGKPRKGDIICVETGNGFKFYLQYLCDDNINKHSSLVRVFKTLYSFDYEPTIKDVLADDIAFYAYMNLEYGLPEKGWHIVVNSRTNGLTEAEKVLFAYAQRELYDSVTREYHFVEPLKNWFVWHINEERKNVGELPAQLVNEVEHGGMMEFGEIIARVVFGYYTNTYKGYSLIKRKPLPDVDSFIRVRNSEDESYYHFKGEYAIEQLILYYGKIIRLTAENPCSGYRKLRTRKFGDTNWRSEDFISKEEFEKAWNNL